MAAPSASKKSSRLVKVLPAAVIVGGALWGGLVASHHRHTPPPPAKVAGAPAVPTFTYSGVMPDDLYDSGQVRMPGETAAKLTEALWAAGWHNLTSVTENGQIVGGIMELPSCDGYPSWLMTKLTGGGRLATPADRNDTGFSCVAWWAVRS